MPVNRAYPVEALLEACRDYYEATGRRISFEYAMIDGVNDSPDCARLLLRRLKGLPAHVNLIPLNEVAESPLHPSSRQAVQQFQRILEEGGLTATVRRTLGGDIDASCGQLRREFEARDEPAPAISSVASAGPPTGVHLTNAANLRRNPRPRLPPGGR